MSTTSTSTSRRVGGIDNNVMSSSADRGRMRRDRTFVGSECAVCEEPLEHTLRGERILQFSCSHVSHEACFYEFIREMEAQYCPTCDAPLHLDSSRGGNVLDISSSSRRTETLDHAANSEVDKISTMVRSAGTESRNGTVTPGPNWENQTVRPPSVDSSQRRQMTQTPSVGRGNHRDGRDSNSERYGSARHARNDSTGMASSNGYPETAQSGSQWRHDYDVQAMEATPSSPRPATRNPIPPPVVTVRSEFPTISRSRQQQTLTCLVTVEVPDNKWRPDPEDIGSPVQSQLTVNPGVSEVAPRAPSPGPAQTQNATRLYPYESADVLEEMTESLRSRVDNWHGLEFNRFGQLRLWGTLRVGKDKVSWQELECYLFAEMLICVKEKKLPPQWDENGAQRKPATRCTLKGSILIKKHLNDVTETGAIDENVLTLNLSVAELPQFHLRFDNRNQLKLWNQALLDLNAVDFAPSLRSPDLDRAEMSETDEDADWGRARQHRGSSIASSWGHKSGTTAPTEYTNVPSKTVRIPNAVHVPIDVVVVVPISSSMQGVKINLVRDALRFMVSTLGEMDRMGLVTFGSGSGSVPMVGMTTKAWPGWSNVLGSIKPVGQKSHRADVVEGANVAMDLLMQRKHNNPIATILLISDASTSDADSVDFVVSRAEAAK